MEIEFDREIDGRWIAEIPELPGVAVYGETKQDAHHKVRELARQVLQDRADHSETLPIPPHAPK